MTRTNRQVRSMLMLASAAALCGTSLTAAGASASAAPGGWTRIDSKFDSGIGRLHVLNDDTLVAVGNDGQLRSKVYVRRPSAQKWDAERPGGRCTNGPSISSGSRVLAVSNCWDKFNNWQRADVWAPGEGWTKRRVPESRPVWSGYDGRLGVGRAMSMPSGKLKLLRKPPVDPVAMVGGKKGRVIALGVRRARVVLTRWRPGKGWSKPKLVARTSNAYTAKQARLATSLGGDIAVLVANRLLTRTVGAKRWSATPISPKHPRSVEERILLSSGQHTFTALWSEMRNPKGDRFRSSVNSRVVSASGRAGPSKRIDEVRGNLYAELDPSQDGWLSADTNTRGGAVIGYTLMAKRDGERVRTSVLRVRAHGDWSKRRTISREKSQRTRVAIDNRGCVAGLADVRSGPVTLVGPKCKVTDD